MCDLCGAHKWRSGQFQELNLSFHLELNFGQTCRKCLYLLNLPLGPYVMFETEWSLKIQAGLELAILQPLPLKCWDCSSVLLFLAMSAYFFKGLCVFYLP